MKRALAAICIAFAATTTSALADDVTDQIDEALKAYQKNDYATAAAALDAANSLLRQKRADHWRALLPEPLAGWKADDAQSTSVSPQVLGGGTSVSRTYHRNGDSIEISLVTDSPLMQGLGSLMSNPLFTNSDTKTLVIDGRKVTFTKTDNSYQMMVANRVLVTVKGSSSVGDDALRAYLAAVDLGAIEKNAQ